MVFPFNALVTVLLVNRLLVAMNEVSNTIENRLKCQLHRLSAIFFRFKSKDFLIAADRDRKKGSGKMKRLLRPNSRMQ